MGLTASFSICRRARPQRISSGSISLCAVIREELLGVPQLRGQLVRQPHLGLHATETVCRHALAARRCDYMIDGGGAAELPLPPGVTLHARLVITWLAPTSAAIRSAGAVIASPTHASTLAMAPREIVRPKRPWQATAGQLVRGNPSLLQRPSSKAAV